MAKGTRTESGTWGGGHWPEEASLSLGITQIQSFLSTQAQPGSCQEGAPGVVMGAVCCTARAGGKGEASCVHEGMGLSDGGGGKKEGRL